MASGIKWTQDEFLKRASEINPDYDFSEALYVNNKTKVKVICKTHGAFYVQAASCFTGTLICPECLRERRKEEFIKKASTTHNGKYDYSRVNYIDSNTKVEVICPIHGSFFVEPKEHVRRSGCPKCSNNYKPSTEEWIESVKNLYGGKYDLSQVEYVTNKTPIKVICPEHGAFYPLPSNYKAGKSGCPKCNNERKREQFSKTTESFIKDAVLKHGNKYDYSKVKYVNKTNLVEIICPTHGAFMQQAGSHLLGCGCPECARASQKKKLTLSTAEFIRRANRVHNGFYKYYKTKYINSDTKVCIICPEHGEFWQLPGNHLKGGGCPKCRNKNQYLLFMKFNSDLPELNLQYEYTPQWLGKMRFDMYSEEYNIAIEYDGAQHYQPIEYMGGETSYLKTVELDTCKNNLCSKNNCKLYRFKYDYDENYYQTVVKEIKSLIEKYV